MKAIMFGFYAVPDILDIIINLSISRYCQRYVGIHLHIGLLHHIAFYELISDHCQSQIQFFIQIFLNIQNCTKNVLLSMKNNDARPMGSCDCKSISISVHLSIEILQHADLKQLFCNTNIYHFIIILSKHKQIAAASRFT